MTRDHDGLWRVLEFAQLFERLEPVYSAQPDVQKDHVEGSASHRFEAGFTAVRDRDFETLVFQDTAQRLSYLCFIIDHENGIHSAVVRWAAWRKTAAPSRLPSYQIAQSAEAAASIAIGSSTMKREPIGSFSSTRMFPLCSCTIRLTIGRPRPVPRFLVEK